MIGRPDVKRTGIGLRMHAYRLKAEPVTGPDGAKRDLAAIGDKHACYFCSSRDVVHAAAPFVPINDSVSPYKTIDFIF